MTIWSTISSTLTPNSTTSPVPPPIPSTSNSPPPPPPPLSNNRPPLLSSNDSTPQTEFEFYDPRGLGAKVRRTSTRRSRSNTPQTNDGENGQTTIGGGGGGGEKVVPTESPGNTFNQQRRRGSSAELVDREGDVRMRANSQEPPPLANGLPIAFPQTPSLPASPTPQARSPPANNVTATASGGGGGGVPLTLGGIQRQPSLKARDAFNRLRIGSFGSSSTNNINNSSTTDSQESESNTTSTTQVTRTLSPDSWDQPNPSRPRNERNSSAPPTSQPYSSSSISCTTTTSSTPSPGIGMGMGMSPAASFLSSFSPTSAPTTSTYNSPNSTPNPNTDFSRRVQLGRGGGGGGTAGFGLLPPKGDQIGFVLPLNSRQILGETFEKDEEEGKESMTMNVDDNDGGKEREEEGGEWVLGKELGSGQMGVVREVLWRPTSTLSSASTLKVQDKNGDGSRSRDRSQNKRRKIAVKIVRKDLFSAGGGGGGSSATGSALEAFGLSPRAAPSTLNQRPLPGSRAASFQLSLPPSSNSTTLRNPSKDRLLGNGFSTGNLERNRSTSSPIKPPSHLFSSTSSSSNHNGTLSPIEQSPLPSPGLGEPATISSSGSPSLEVEPSPEQTLLLTLLNRELTLWTHITNISDTPLTSHHPNIVPLLSTYDTSEFSYVFMPSCDGGSLLHYLNSPPSTRDEVPLDLLVSSTSSSSDRTDSSSRSRDRNSSSSSSRGRNTLPRVKPRGSLPFASTSSSPSTSLSSSTRTSRFLSPPPQPQEKAMNLLQAGKVFSEIVAGLKWLHQVKRVVHKDVKLENLLSVWEEREVSGCDDEGDSEDETETELEEDGSRKRRGRSETKTRKKNWQRVWKLADFGLSEIIPSTSSPTVEKSKALSPVVGVQPLSSLARGGSLHHTSGRSSNNNNSKHSQLSSSVGPSSTTSSSSSVTPRLPPSHHSSILIPPLASSESTLTTHLHPIGSLPYSSPESLKSPIPIIDPSIDIWALGCVLYAMVEGVLPIWDEWEYRLRSRLIKGEWEIPENLKEVPGESRESREEKNNVLEVIRGCLEKDVEKRWDIVKIENSEWLNSVKRREEETRKGVKNRTRRNALSLQLDTTNLGGGLDDSEMKDSVLELIRPPPSPARGRPSNARPLLPALSSLSYSSSAASSTPGSTSTSRSSSSRSLNRNSTNGRPSPVLSDALSLASISSHPHPNNSNNTAATMRRPSRSTSRSSAYSHQGVDSRTQMEELRERGRSQRRLRWDEEKETSRRRRSESRDALEGAILGLEESSLGGRGRSSSRSSLQKGKGKSRERPSTSGGATGHGGSGERLETVRDEPY